MCFPSPPGLEAAQNRHSFCYISKLQNLPAYKDNQVFYSAFSYRWGHGVQVQVEILLVVFSRDSSQAEVALLKQPRQQSYQREISEEFHTVHTTNQHEIQMQLNTIIIY